jgi:hypothetical protein
MSLPSMTLCPRTGLAFKFTVKRQKQKHIDKTTDKEKNWLIEKTNIEYRVRKLGNYKMG